MTKYSHWVSRNIRNVVFKALGTNENEVKIMWIIRCHVTLKASVSMLFEQEMCYTGSCVEWFVSVVVVLGDGLDTLADETCLLKVITAHGMWSMITFSIYMSCQPWK